METKVCNHCGRELPVIMFSKSSKAKDGLQGSCKECMAKMNKERAARLKAEKKEKKESLEKALKDAPIGAAVVMTENGTKFIKIKNLVDYDTRELCAELKRRGIVWENMWVKQSIDYGKIEL